MNPFEVESSSVERLGVDVVTSADPSAADPEFQLTTGDRTDPDPDGWEAGEWDSTWQTVNGRINANTPTMGETGTATLGIEQGVLYDLWARWTVGDEAPVRRVAQLRGV